MLLRRAHLDADTLLRFLRAIRPTLDDGHHRTGVPATIAWSALGVAAAGFAALVLMQALMLGG